MKVLWLSHFVPWPATGMGMLQRSHHLLRQVASDHEVHLVALNDPALLEPDQLPAARAALAGHCAAVDIVRRDGGGARGTRALALTRAMLTARPYDAAWMTSAALRRRLRALAREQHFDLVHVDSVGLAPNARRFTAPVVQNHHNVESAMLRRRADAEPSRWRRALFRHEAAKLARLERRSARRTALHLTVSEVDGRRLRQIVGDGAIRVVPNGVDTAWFAPQRPLGHGDGGLVFAGALDWYPNREAMRFFTREVWPLLAHDAPERRLAIVGRSAPPDLQQLAGARGITLPGFVEDVRPWLDDASIYVCPIRDGGGTRLKVLDAMAMAKPIVATTLAVEGLALEEGVHYLRADAPAEWLRQVRRLEADGELRRRMAAANRALALERFDWRSIGRELAAAYRDALNCETRVPAPDRGRRPATPRCPDATRAGAG